MTEHYKGLLEDYERPDFAKTKKLLQYAIDRQSQKPQAILRITGYLCDGKRMENHIDYITRNGKLELSDQDGLTSQGKEQSHDHIDDWAVDFTPVSQRAETTKLVLKVDAGGDHKVLSVYDQLKAFAAEGLEQGTWRVDKSRSKSTPNQVTLTATVFPDRAGQVRESLEGFEQDQLSQYRSEVKENTGRLPRNAMKLMLSSPEGTKPHQVKKAAVQFSRAAFGEKGFRYLAALHTDTNNPHVHVIVKMVNEGGQRLSTNKPDLHRWRELWAEKSREQGIDVVAVPNYLRGVSRGRIPNAAYHATKKDPEKGKPTRQSHYHETVDKVVKEAVVQGSYTATQREIGAIKRNLKTRQEYLDAAKLLRKQVASLDEGMKKQQLIKMASVLEKEAIELPMPQTTIQMELAAEGRKTGIKITTLLTKVVTEEFRKALKTIDETLVKDTTRVTKQSKENGEREQELGD